MIVYPCCTYNNGVYWSHQRERHEAQYVGESQADHRQLLPGTQAENIRVELFNIQHKTVINRLVYQDLDTPSTSLPR